MGANNSVEDYEICLLRLYGAIIGGKTLRHLLGYRTGDAFRQAIRNKRLPIPTFFLPDRRMHMARTHDVAVWLHSLGTDIHAIKLKSDEEGGAP